MPNKVTREIAAGVKQQKKKAYNVAENEQGCYIDASRNIAVNLDSTELSKTLKKPILDDDEIPDTGIVNSEMYQREALHFSSKRLYREASEKLSLAHKMCPSNTDILASLAHSLLNCGEHQEALRCAEKVLCQNTRSSKALLAKAESLYNTCDFEHSLMLFIRK